MLSGAGISILIALAVAPVNESNHVSPATSLAQSQISQQPESSLITWKSLTAQLFERHDGAPIPSAPEQFCWAWNGIPSYLKHPKKPKCDQNNSKSGRLPDSFARRGNRFNVWTHIDSAYTSSAPNTAVQFGQIKMALLKNGTWLTKTFPASCKGYLFKVGATEKRTGKAANCSKDRSLATIGLGIRDWSSPTQHYHGWPGEHLKVGSETIEQVLVYAPVRLVKVDPNQPADFTNNQYTVALGADSRSAQDAASGKGKLTAITHGRHQKLNSDGSWTALTAHTMSEKTLLELCLSRNLPEKFPFENNCDVPQS